MSEKQINEQIQKDYDAFNESKYEGDPLPKDLIERLKVALFKLPPNVHKMASQTMTKLINTKVTELTNYEVGHILNLITAVPLCDIYRNLEEALIKNQQIEFLKIAYNLTVKQINEKVEEKRQGMLRLASPNKSSMKIISAEA